MREPAGVLNIYKEKGYTSHDVVSVVRKTIGAKAGHTGTLDPQAEGVLPICVGKATRIADYITGSDKEYRAELILGKTTDTEDLTGNMLEMRPVVFDRAEISRVITSFKGEYAQTPPMYSAVKINGRKLYELAREGKTADRKQRLVRILDIGILSYDEANNTVVIQVACSKGTYIRSLCADIGRLLGCGACMGELLRTRAGSFTLYSSIRLGALKSSVSNGSLDQVLQPVETVLPYKKVTIKEEAHKLLLNGNKISMEYVDADSIAYGEKVLAYSYCDNKNTAGIYEMIADENPYLKAVTLFL